jgi:hypothetical protein
MVYCTWKTRFLDVVCRLMFLKPHNVSETKHQTMDKIQKPSFYMYKYSGVTNPCNLTYETFMETCYNHIYKCMKHVGVSLFTLC